MQRSFQHSAEGSTWTKKNHKYIRKEGNRYIYPKDVTAKSNEAKAQSHAKASNMPANEARQLSQQRANRKAAANGGPSKHTVLYYDHKSGAYNEDNYTSDQEWAKNRTAKGSARSSWTKDQLNQKKRSKALNSQGSVNRQQEAKDFKEYQDWENSYYKRQDQKSKLATNSNKYKTSGSGLTETQRKNRKDAANGNGKIYGTISVKGKASPEERKRENYINDQVIGNAAATKYHLNTSQQAAKELSARRSEKSKNELKRKKAMIAQGETNKGSQAYAKINAPVGNKRAKRLAEEKEVRAKRRRFLDDQGREKGQEYAQAQGRKALYDLHNEKDRRKKVGIQTGQEFMVDNASNKLKKKGYFTMKNGKSVFVPSDEITMKKMNKAEKLVNKIKSKFSKKKK